MTLEIFSESDTGSERETEFDLADSSCQPEDESDGDSDNTETDRLKVRFNLSDSSCQPEDESDDSDSEEMDIDNDSERGKGNQSSNTESVAKTQIDEASGTVKDC